MGQITCVIGVIDLQQYVFKRKRRC